MKRGENLHLNRSILWVPGILLFLMWITFWLEFRFGWHLKDYGIRPAKLTGILGTFSSPFLHADLEHLFNNSIPIIVLVAMLFYFYRDIAWKVFGIGWLLTGILTWIIATSGNHIGASGIIYMLSMFLFFAGIISKNYRLIAVSLLVVFLYGGLVWYLFPILSGISWEGHLAGAISGLILVFIFRDKISKITNKDPDELAPPSLPDPFLEQFDEQGNFIDRPKNETKSTDAGSTFYRYVWRESKEE